MAAFVNLLVATIPSHGSGQDRTAPRPVSYSVRATLSDDAELGALTTIGVDAGRASALRFWLYSDRLAEPPEAMDELSAQWIFPREVERSPVQVMWVEVDGHRVPFQRVRGGGERGRDRSGTDLRVALPASTQGRQVTVRIRTRQRLPERFGRLGAIGDRVALTGPWYPLLVRGDVWAFDDVPHRVQLKTALEVVAGEPSRRRGATTRVGNRGPFLPLVLLERAHITRLRADLPFEVVASHELYRAPPANAQGTAALEDLAHIDVPRRIQSVVQSASATWRMAGLPATALRAPLRIVLAPLRTELAAYAPGLVLVSDRIYELFPLEDLQALHDRVLARAIFGALLARHVREPPADADWALDLRAVLLTDLDTVRRRGEVSTAKDLIDWAGFHPSIDQLLYAPQIAFVDSYFGTVSEPDRFRDHPDRSRRPRARGRRVLEYARDRLSEDDFRRAAASLLRSDRDARSILRTAGIADATLNQWLASPGLEVNYRLGTIHSRRVANGWRHRIEVIRDGAQRPEPVQVRVIDDAGHEIDATWGGAERRGFVVVETPNARAQVRMDPRQRLPQSAEVADGHPLADDAERLPFRPPIIQGVNFSVSATERALVGLVELAVRRQYDLRRIWSFRADTDPRSTGGLLRYTHGVGRKRDTNYRVGALSVGLTGDRLHEGFSSEGLGGWRIGLLASAGYSTLRYFLDPHQGSRVVGAVQYGLVRRDNGRISQTVAPSVRGNLTLPVGLRQVFTLAANVSWVFGEPLAGELPGLGGRFLLRGYQTDELVGRGRAFAVVEYRFTPTIFSDLDIDVLHLAWIRRIQLAAFAGAGVVYAEREGRSWAAGAEVGGGIRVHFEYAGVQPGVMAIDISRPLIRDAEARSSRPPIAFILGFEQYY